MGENAREQNRSGRNGRPGPHWLRRSRARYSNQVKEIPERGQGELDIKGVTHPTWDIRGVFKKEIDMKAKLDGPMNCTANLRLRFRTCDLDLPMHV